MAAWSPPSRVWGRAAISIARPAERRLGCCWQSAATSRRRSAIRRSEVRHKVALAYCSSRLRGLARPTEFQRRIVDRAEPQAQQVAHVILVEPPRLLRSLARELVDRALDIAGREVDQRFGLDRRIVLARRAHHIAAAIHIV